MGFEDAMGFEDLERQYDRRAAGFQPWIRSSDDAAEQAAWQALLARKAGASFGPGAYVAPGARVFTHSLVLGEGSWIAEGAIIRGHVRIGTRSSINPYAHVAGAVTIGSDVMVASLASIYGFNHGFERTDIAMRHQPLTHAGVIIGDDTWIGANAVILDGTQVGAHSIIAAGAIVTRSVPEYAIVGGNPGRIIGDRRERPTAAPPGP